MLKGMQILLSSSKCKIQEKYDRVLGSMMDFILHIS